MRRHVVITLAAAVLLLGAGAWLAGCAVFGDGTGSTSTSRLPSSSTSVAASTSTTTAAASTSTTGSPTITATTTTAAPQPSPSTSSTTAKPGTTGTTAKTSTPAKDYTLLPTKEKVVALTFDAAYDPKPLAAILAALKAADARGTFFLTGEFIRDFPAETKKIVAAGYPIGNHSYSHPDFTTISDAKIRDQIRRTAAAIEKIGGGDPKPLFRAPYGALSKHVLSLLKSEGYVSVFWTIDTLDWETERTPAQIEAAVLGKLKPGAIVLMHVGSKQTASILPTLLKEIKARGYRFVDLREALPEAR